MDPHTRTYDLLIVGGGINGAGIARDAAGRGLSVLLVEQGDLAGATSSASSKLIHGGLRYLEHYEFRLVREALAEREVMLNIAPHLVRPMTFVLPHDQGMRPRWMIRTGLFLYDHLARRNRLAGSQSVDLAKPPLGAGLRADRRAGFTYADCWVDDARLVISNAIDAKERGADIRTRCRLERARRTQGVWEAELSGPSGQTSVRARVLVNAAGPWVGNVIAASGENSQAHVRLIKGSHIVVPRLYPGDHAFILQNEDRRVVFAIPYEGRFTLIGTTDVPYQGDAAKVAITGEETTYLCAAVGRYFAQAPTPGDVVWSYAGVRPLYDDDEGDPSAVTRDYVLELDGGGERAPMLSVFGGKITTYRRLAEEALQKLSPHLAKAGRDWTATAALPGGDIAGGDFDAFLMEMRRRRPWLGDDRLLRMARSYGSRLDRVLGGATSAADLGADLGAGLSEREAAYLVGHEWARTADDILWRRTKLGLHGGPVLAAAVSDWLGKQSRT